MSTRSAPIIYFDHNATSPLLPEAREVWLEATETLVGNPSSPHRIGSRAEVALAGARERLAALLQCDPLDIVWTSGATESNNTVLHHLAFHAPATEEIWISAIEHPCVRETAHHYFPNRVRSIPATSSGIVDLGWMEKRIKKMRPVAIAVLAANNETGVLQPWRQTLVLARSHGVPFFCDATQWIGKLPATGLGECDFVSGSGHKFGGPRGVGFLKCPAQGRIEPLLLGGPQEEGRRAGTENVASVLAMMAALEVRTRAIADGGTNRRLDWRQTFERNLAGKVPGSVIVGMKEERLWNTVSALMPDTHCQSRWVVKLDKLGFAVSTGSACASGREEPSHVLTAMGYRSSEASRVLRFSSGWETTPADWEGLAQALARVRAESPSPRRSKAAS